ncbi:MAG: 6-carboxytetrahydropterin synthase QueD [Candidatus Sumerlaeia bacterium]
MEIYHRFHFDSAHRLTRVSEDHPCSVLHGHRFGLEIRLRGKVDPDKGWFIDFHDVEKAVRPLLEQLDHATLNDVSGLENPTSENLCLWFWKQLKPQLPPLSEVRITESPECGAVYRGEDS